MDIDTDAHKEGRTSLSFANFRSGAWDSETQAPTETRQFLEIPERWLYMRTRCGELHRRCRIQQSVLRKIRRH